MEIYTGNTNAHLQFIQIVDVWLQVLMYIFNSMTDMKYLSKSKKKGFKIILLITE